MKLLDILNELEVINPNSDIYDKDKLKLFLIYCTNEILKEFPIPPQQLNKFIQSLNGHQNTYGKIDYYNDIYKLKNGNSMRRIKISGIHFIHWIYKDYEDDLIEIFKKAADKFRFKYKLNTPYITLYFKNNYK